MTLSRIDSTFQKKRAEGHPALVAYVTVGFPSVEESYQCALAALEAGADMLELGVPFSDPSADGPVIAKASFEAISAGGSLRAALRVARRLRETRSEPIILFSYYNPVVAFGDAELPGAMVEHGVDGVLLVDLPPDEGEELRRAAKQHDVAVVPLLAPTSGREREDTILAGASGFIYYVSVTGVTGSGVAPLDEAGRHAAELTQRSGLPVVVGFGIDSAEKARRASSAGASGVVVGTAIIRTIGEAPAGQKAEAVRAFVSELVSGLDA
jgi:tryptophan synthase alpha chain